MQGKINKQIWENETNTGNNSKGKKKRTFSEEHKRKLSESKKGKKRSAETIKKIREANLKNPNRYWLGKKRPDISLLMSKICKGRPSPQKGQKRSKETREKLKKAMTGRKVSEETKEKHRIAMTGERNHQWKGGISFEPYPTNWTDDLRESIRKRDDYTCQMCGIHQDELNGWAKKLDIHHIDYDKNNLDPKNLISLCASCHRKTNHNREYWVKHFHNINTKIRIAYEY